jgi:hypothetical protein
MAKKALGEHARMTQAIKMKKSEQAKRLGEACAHMADGGDLELQTGRGLPLAPNDFRVGVATGDYAASLAQTGAEMAAGNPSTVDDTPAPAAAAAPGGLPVKRLGTQSAWSYSGNHIALAAGGPVRGPGGPVDDKVNAKLSNGEYVLPVDTVAAVGGGDHAAGVAQLDQLKQATHTPADYQRLGLPNRQQFPKGYRDGGDYTVEELPAEEIDYSKVKPPRPNSIGQNVNVPPGGQSAEAAAYNARTAPPAAAAPAPATATPQEAIAPVQDAAKGVSQPQSKLGTAGRIMNGLGVAGAAGYAGADMAANGANAGNVAGMAGAGLMAVPHPIAKAAGMALSLGAPLVQRGWDALKAQGQGNVPPTAEQEGMAFSGQPPQATTQLGGTPTFSDARYDAQAAQAGPGVDHSGQERIGADGPTPAGAVQPAPAGFIDQDARRALINKGSSDYTSLGNYGTPGQEIQGRSTNGSTKMNDFTGHGPALGQSNGPVTGFGGATPDDVARYKQSLELTGLMSGAPVYHGPALPQGFQAAQAAVESAAHGVKMATSRPERNQALAALSAAQAVLGGLQKQHDTNVSQSQHAFSGEQNAFNQRLGFASNQMNANAQAYNTAAQRDLDWSKFMVGERNNAQNRFDERAKLSHQWSQEAQADLDKTATDAVAAMPGLDDESRKQYAGAMQTYLRTATKNGTSFKDMNPAGRRLMIGEAQANAIIGQHLGDSRFLTAPAQRLGSSYDVQGTSRGPELGAYVNQKNFSFGDMFRDGIKVGNVVVPWNRFPHEAQEYLKAMKATREGQQ